MTVQSDSSDIPFVIDGIDIRVLARRQRIFLRCVALAILAITLLILLVAVFRGGLLSPILERLLIISSLLGPIIFLVGFVFLLAGMGMDVVSIIILLMILAIPIVNVIFVLLTNLTATHLLRKAGLKVGWLGVRKDEMALKFSVKNCRNCGYNLTGNVSGICPECGNTLAAEQRQHVQPA